MPTRSADWMKEIAAAYADAREAIPFGSLAGADITDATLFHLAPAVSLKFRGIPRSKAMLKRATEAALSSYVAMTNRDPDGLSSPPMAFAFSYVAAHFGLDLVTEEIGVSVLNYIERHEERLAREIDALIGGR